MQVGGTRVEKQNKLAKDVLKVEKGKKQRKEKTKIETEEEIS